MKSAAAESAEACGDDAISGFSPTNARAVDKYLGDERRAKNGHTGYDRAEQHAERLLKLGFKVQIG